MQNIDLTIWLKELADSYVAQALEKNLSFTLDLPPQPINVEVNPDLLHQAVTNLLNNACKYTPDGGTVELSLLRRSPWAIIQVKDSGIGIPPQDLPYIFERFYRIDKKRSRKTGGFGLGLAIAQQIAQVHGGEINVSSTFGRGSSFQIKLPLQDRN